MEEDKEITNEQKAEVGNQEAGMEETATTEETNNQQPTTNSQLEETTDRLKRIMAEFDNYKKRSVKEREDLYGMILADIVGKILPIIDNLEKASQANTKDEEYKQGIELLYKQFMDVLISLGVKKIETVGTKFDPELHEAVSTVQDENYGEKMVSAEFRAGYIIGNKVIRHAMVVVAN
ncbi:MAG: nucleotide exchange factor GrpE [Oscillospiraceae bacterium]|nr:nucleotide exchange factor GrpE [Oscillospiraceae bacterium]